MSAPTATKAIEQVADELRARDRFLLTAHEGPDGDALGSLLGMHHLLTQLGKDSVMFMAAKEFPLPIEYRFLPLEEVFHEPPADMADRTVIFLDCGNIDRMPVDFLSDGDNRIINIDHHHDNTLFGDVNLVDTDASCTAEIVYELARLLGVKIGKEMASALYVGLVTDTGKFMYENTDARTHRIAAELIEAGVEVDDTYRRLYEHVPIEKLRLVSRALDGIQRDCDDRLVLTYVTAADYEATGAGEEMTEGIIDHLRSVEGAKVAALDPRPGQPRPRRAQGQPALQRRGRRRLGDRPRARRRGAQARRRLLHRPRAGGAGRLHLRRGRCPARLLTVSGRDRRGRAALRQAGRDNLARHGGASATGARLQGGSRGDARPVRDRPAAGPAGTGDAAPALPHRAAEDLRGEGAARLALQHRRPRRRADRDRARPGVAASCPPARSASGCR